MEERSPCNGEVIVTSSTLDIPVHDTFFSFLTSGQGSVGGSIPPFGFRDWFPVTATLDGYNMSDGGVSLTSC